MNTQAIDDTPSPPTWDEHDLQAKVDCIAGHLARAAEGIRPGWELSHALLSLSNRRGVISAAQREQIGGALVLFSIVADCVLPSDIPRDRLAPGLEAAFAQLYYWSLSPEQRQSIDCAERLDMGARARLLRNAAHDSCLLADIKERDDERRREAAIADFAFGDFADGYAH